MKTRLNSASIPPRQMREPKMKKTQLTALASDAREIPTYTISEAAHYLLIPPATLRSWTVGRYYPVQHGRRLFKPILSVPQESPVMLSFVNLIEAHVLDAIRRE